MESLELLAYSPPGWGRNLIRGLFVTIQIALGAYALGLAIGMCGAMGKLHGPKPLRWFLEGYTTIIRAVPELVLILLLFYAGTDLLGKVMIAMGKRPVDIPALWAGIYVIGFVQGAYTTEVFRAAFQSIPFGQVEAARAVGLKPLQILLRISIPVMLPAALPGLANLWLIATKETALLAVIGLSELALETRQAASSTRSYFIFYVAAACLYLSLSLVSSAIFSLIERYFRRGQPEQN